MDILRKASIFEEALFLSNLLGRRLDLDGCLLTLSNNLKWNGEMHDFFHAQQHVYEVLFVLSLSAFERNSRGKVFLQRMNCEVDVQDHNCERCFLPFSIWLLILVKRRG